MNDSSQKPARPFGWYIALGVVLIFLGTVVGAVGILVTARKKQMYRIPESESPRPAASTNAASATPVKSEAIASANGMIWIPDGKFWMSSDVGLPDERPLHEVSVDGFWMDRTEITNEQFECFVKATGLSHSGFRCVGTDTLAS